MIFVNCNKIFEFRDKYYKHREEDIIDKISDSVLGWPYKLELGIMSSTHSGSFYMDVFAKTKNIEQILLNSPNEDILVLYKPIFKRNYKSQVENTRNAIEAYKGLEKNLREKIAQLIVSSNFMDAHEF